MSLPLPQDRALRRHIILHKTRQEVEKAISDAEENQENEVHLDIVSEAGNPSHLNLRYTGVSLFERGVMIYYFVSIEADQPVSIRIPPVGNPSVYLPL